MRIDHTDGASLLIIFVRPAKKAEEYIVPPWKKST